MVHWKQGKGMKTAQKIAADPNESLTFEKVWKHIAGTWIASLLNYHFA
jgi:hypothetical protein